VRGWLCAGPRRAQCVLLVGCLLGAAAALPSRCCVRASALHAALPPLGSPAETTPGTPTPPPGARCARRARRRQPRGAAACWCARRRPPLPATLARSCLCWATRLWGRRWRCGGPWTRRGTEAW
jgi:hypothetical protein